MPKNDPKWGENVPKMVISVYYVWLKPSTWPIISKIVKVKSDEY